MRRVMRVLVIAAAITAVWAPAEVRAEGYISPWIGVNFANSDLFDLGTDLDAGRTAFGVSAGAMGGGIIGGEFDFGYSPSFFADDSVFGDNNLMTIMGNLIVGIPIGGQTGGGVRPYATAGVGLIRSDSEGLFDDAVEGTSNNDFGFNLGAGVMGFFGDHVGVRGDVRYFRTINSDLGDSDLDPEFDLGDFDFWRASIGIVFR